jgi:hypothetical protein
VCAQGVAGGGTAYASVMASHRLYDLFESPGAASPSREFEEEPDAGSRSRPSEAADAADTDADDSDRSGDQCSRTGRAASDPLIRTEQAGPRASSSEGTTRRADAYDNRCIGKGSGEWEEEPRSGEIKSGLRGGVFVFV